MKKWFLLFILAWSCSNIQAQSLTIEPGTSWKTDNTTFVVLNNTDFQYNTATALLNNTFKFTGTGGSNIYGNELPIFRSIQVAKTGTGKVILQRSMNLSQTIDFQGGNFDLNGFMINMGTNALLNNENENSHITGNDGYIRITNTLNTPAAANPGNLGAVITSAQNLGSTIITRGVKSQTNGNGFGNSILRYYDITPANNTGLDATLRVNYFDAELNSLPESSLVMWKSDNGTNWSVQGYTGRDASANYVEKSGIAGFSRWTLSSVNNILPVNFTLFNAHCNANSVLLNWKTAQEQNSSYFEVQKSSSNAIFSTIGTVPAAGNSSTEKTYSYTDNNVSPNTVFYRIAETDIDGRKQYTAIHTVHCGTLYDELKVWPNPVQQMLFININATAASPVAVKVYDNNGSLIHIQNSSLFRGSNVVAVDLNNLASGNYCIYFEWGNGHFHKTANIVKQ